MLYTVGTVPDSSSYIQSTLAAFLEWVRIQLEYQLDVETTVTGWWCDKKLVTIQFGSIDGQTQWVIHWISLSEQEKEQVRIILRNRQQTKLIHNALFEYVVLAFHGVLLNNIYDTMLAEQVIYGGQASGKGPTALPVGFYSLLGLADRYLCVDLDKSQQMTFSDTKPLTEEQVIYAADDVVYIAPIRRMQMDALKVQVSGAPLEFTAALEMEALLSYGDMIVEGMTLDTRAWLANLDLVEPIIQEAERACYEIVQSDEALREKAIELEYLNEHDKPTINWSSPSQVHKLLKILDPDIAGTSQALIKKLVRDGHKDSRILQYWIDKDYQNLGQYMYDNFRTEMVEAELIRPGGDIYINWNSQPQVLPLLRAISPKMKSMDEEAMNKFPHPIGVKIKEYKDTLKLRTTYGEQFIEKYLEPDGKIRTTINQVVTTGRASSRKPNMQNIPAKETVGNRYRNCFVAGPGKSYVSGDYTGQELCIIAYLSKDEVWIDALEKGQDIHSVCAYMVWPKKWKEAAEPTCEFYALDSKGQMQKLKCSCKKHKPIRYDTKAIDFGLAYGMTEYKLAADAKVSVKQARAIIADYFGTFGKIGRLLNYFGKFGVENGYIQTIWPFFRKRYFPEWKNISAQDIKYHVEGIQHNWKLAEIERASKNMPIQGCAGDMAKLSICMIRWYIDDNNLRDRVWQVMQVHDQDDTIAINEYAEEWKDHLGRIMEEAALFLIPNGLVKADVQITEAWSK